MKGTQSHIGGERNIVRCLVSLWLLSNSILGVKGTLLLPRIQAIGVKGTQSLPMIQAIEVKGTQ
ncbi:hypothetical protein HYC85_029167 [Camellia sinensis]|uniref:Uncharacterized protein n=1 Tax=Camellia sinensis TaxID=4442 RepID=A0A7J7G187_CAMSI|nr:hypothetical protein HYC85_029167 [Camellia sinensis]